MDPSILCFDPAILCLDPSILCFDPAILCLDPSILCLDPSILCFDPSILCLDPKNGVRHPVRLGGVWLFWFFIRGFVSFDVGGFFTFRVGVICRVCVRQGSEACLSSLLAFGPARARPESPAPEAAALLLLILCVLFPAFCLCGVWLWGLACGVCCVIYAF